MALRTHIWQTSDIWNIINIAKNINIFRYMPLKHNIILLFMIKHFVAFIYLCNVSIKTYVVLLHSFITTWTYIFLQYQFFIKFFDNLGCYKNYVIASWKSNNCNLMLLDYYKRINNIFDFCHKYTSLVILFRVAHTRTTKNNIFIKCT